MEILNTFIHSLASHFQYPFTFFSQKSAIKILYQNMHMEKCTTREMQFKTTVRYHYTLIRMAKI